MYQKSRQRMLTGSMSLLPPGNKVQDPDALWICNFRADQAGKLRSRRGMLHLTGFLPGGRLHSLYRRGALRYGVIGDTLRRGTGLEVTVTTGFSSSYPVTFAAVDQFVWCMNPGKAAKVNGDVAYSWIAAAPTAAPAATEGSAGAITGTVQYYVTFDTPDGHETAPGPASTSITVAAKQVNLASIPVSADPNVDRRHIYRSGGGLPAAVRVFTIGDNVTTTAVDDISVAQANATNIQLPDNHQPPPNGARGVVGPWRGRLICYNTSSRPNRIWYTPVDRFWYFPGSDDDNEGNWLDVGEDFEEILAVIPLRQMLVVLKERSIWRIPGDPDRTDPEPTNAGQGLAGVRALAWQGNDVYFLGSEGVYRFNGDQAVDVSTRIRPIFIGEYTEIANGIQVRPIDRTRLGETTMAIREDRLYLSYAEAGRATSDVNQTLVMHLGTGSWYQHQIDEVGGATGFTCLYNEGPSDDFLGAIYTPSGAALYRMETNDDDDGLDIPLRFQSGYVDAGFPDTEKLWNDLVVDCRTSLTGANPTTLTVKIRYNNGTEVAVGTIQSAIRDRFVFPLGTKGAGLLATNLAVAIEGESLAGVEIYDVFIHYQKRERWARVFDSGILDFDTPEMKIIEEIEMEVSQETTTPMSALRFEAYVENPLTGVLAEVESGTIAGVAGRRVVRTTFNAVRGRRVRLVVRTLVTEGRFQVHACRVKVVPVPLYLAGALAQKWTSQPFGN